MRMTACVIIVAGLLGCRTAAEQRAESVLPLIVADHADEEVTRGIVGGIGLPHVPVVTTLIDAPVQVHVRFGTLGSSGGSVPSGTGPLLVVEKIQPDGSVCPPRKPAKS